VSAAGDAGADADWRALAHRGATAVVLASGGLDSGVALALWHEAGGRTALALTADYGQRAAAAEKEAAARLAARYGIPWRLVDLGWLAAAGREAGSALFDGPLPAPAPDTVGDEASARAVWVPARNVVLCAVAAAFAEAKGAGAVLAGFNAEEAATFPDNSARFVRAFGAVLRDGCRRPVVVVAPTQTLGKAEIAVAALRLGLRPADFWSCYAAGPQPCGACESCLRSARAFAAAGKT